MGSLCCHFIAKEKSNQMYINEGLIKHDIDRSLVTQDSTPYKCIMPNQAMMQSKMSSNSHMTSSQLSNYQPITMDPSVNHVFYKQNTIDTQRGSLKPVEDDLYQFMDFPFLTSLSIIKWMQSTKILFIIRGPSGSGKSTIVDCLTDKFHNATVCSSDNLFMEYDGTLKCDRSRLNEADNFCQNQAYQSLEAGKSPIIIDNAHIRCIDYKYYVDLSIKFDYIVMMVVPKTPWRFDVEQLHEKSPKSEPIWEIEKSINQFEPAIPLYFGWFLNDKNSDTILQLATDILELLLGIQEIRIGLASAFDLPEFASKEDLLDHWRIKTDRLHVTTKFCGYGTSTDSENYLNSGAVQESLGQLFPIHIKGLLLTPRTFSCHIQLAGPKQIQLWAGDDQEEVSVPVKSINKSASLGRMSGLAKLNGTKSTRRPFGCRAHMALMLSEDTRPVQSGLDQLQVIDLQLKGEKTASSMIVESGTITDWTQGLYYLELNYPIICQALFTGQY